MIDSGPRRRNKAGLSKREHRYIILNYLTKGASSIVTLRPQRLFCRPSIFGKWKEGYICVREPPGKFLVGPRGLLINNDMIYFSTSAARPSRVCVAHSKGGFTDGQYAPIALLEFRPEPRLSLVPVRSNYHKFVHDNNSRGEAARHAHLRERNGVYRACQGRRGPRLSSCPPMTIWRLGY